jgi:hypothetical protein
MTIPAPSWPGMHGRGGIEMTPLTSDKSEWQIPAALYSTKTSPVLGFSKPNSSMTNGFRYSYKTAAFVFILLSPLISIAWNTDDRSSLIINQWSLYLG